MVPLVRGPTPAVLQEKAAAWTAKYLAERQGEPSKRPDHRCYGHAQVRLELRRMSGHKCFYCERKLTEREQEVDHYVEVAERPQDAFTWENLCLSCESCNSDKASNRTHPVSACLDPCVPGVAAEEHLLFDGENIGVRNNSSLGRSTIRKYNLDRDDLNLARLKALQELSDAVIAVLTRAQAEGRKVSTPERSLIRAFAESTRPFSLMMQAKLEHLGW
jgi:uncharacterized protein (TIGR02646 family)